MDIKLINIAGMFCFIFGFLSVYCAANNNLDQQSPCPEFFQYKYDYNLNQYYGYLEIPPQPLGTTMTTIVNLTLRTRLIGRFNGSISTIHSQKNVLRDIALGNTVKYRVMFPMKWPLPRLTSIISNNQVICSGPADTGHVVTVLKLNHTIHTQRFAYRLALAAHKLIHGIDGDRNGGTGLQSRLNIPTTRPVVSPVVLPDLTPTFINDPMCGKGSKHFNQLVVKGKKTNRGEFPWSSALFLSQENGLQFHCGGTLISEEVIVTAAHCVKDDNDNDIPPSKFVVLLGKSDLHDWSEDKIITIGVSEIVPHPDYLTHNSTFDADIAILWLKKKVAYNKFIKPICLWDQGDSVTKLEGTMGTVVGWGKNGRTTSTSKPLMGVAVQIVSESQCLRSDPAFQFMTSNRTFCAGNLNGSGPCNGDSGGALMIEREGRWYFRGIISTSLLDPKTGSCDLNKYVVFTDVAKFQSWIVDVLDK